MLIAQELFYKTVLLPRLFWKSLAITLWIFLIEIDIQLISQVIIDDEHFHLNNIRWKFDYFMIYIRVGSNPLNLSAKTSSNHWKKLIWIWLYYYYAFFYIVLQHIFIHSYLHVPNINFLLNHATNEGYLFIFQVMTFAFEINKREKNLIIWLLQSLDFVNIEILSIILENLANLLIFW